MKLANPPSEERLRFIPEQFYLESWEGLLPFFQDLLDRPIRHAGELEHWLLDKSELDAFLSEEFSWRYIRLSQNSEDREALAQYRFAIQEIYPHITAWEHKLNEKLISNPFTEQLSPQTYAVHVRLAKNASQIFHEDNVPLLTEVQLQTKEYGRIFSQMTIGLDGKQMTLQKATILLEEKDRERRRQVYQKINERILEDTESLEGLFDELLSQRNQVAQNAGFANYRDFAFRQLNRFDYTPQECYDLHDAVAKEILPILDELNHIRREKLHIKNLRPWDLNIDVMGEEPLQPFMGGKDLLSKGVQCLSQIHPRFGETIRLMQEHQLIDVESRPGKSPGGYNIPLQVRRVPFIFMNATSSLNDVRTLMHECGHAIHFYLTRDLPLVSSRRFPSEVSELAAMTMELLAMDHWSVFLSNPQDLIRARISQLENVLKVLPWIVTIDKFQHWLYLNPRHTREERKAEWLRMLFAFSPSTIDYSGLDRYLEYLWHKQLHLFEAPFYYIEYGIAQLGALAIWKQYREDPERAVSQFMQAMQLGNTRPIREIYRTAGIEFRFDRAYISELAHFTRGEIHRLMQQIEAK